MATGYARLRRRSAWAPCPVVCPYMAPSTATLAVGRSAPSWAATGACRSSARVAAPRARSPATVASTRGSIWPRSARTNTYPSPAVTAGRMAAGMLWSPPGAGIPPPAPALPAPARRVAGAAVLAHPAVAVGGGDPLGLAPLQQRGHQRVGLAQGLEPPGPGVGHVDPDRGQKRLDLAGAAQVGGDPGRRVPQHLGVAGGPVPARGRLV